MRSLKASTYCNTARGWVPGASAQSAVLPFLPPPLQEMMVNTGDLGQDLEHCLQLCRWLHKFQGTKVGTVPPLGSMAPSRGSVASVTKGGLKCQLCTYCLSRLLGCLRC